MLNPERFTNDLLDNEKLWDYNLRAFTEDHLLRLSIPANNPGGIYSPLITATTTAYNTFFGAMSSETIKRAISEGLTITMENNRTAVIGYLSQLQGLIKFVFTETSPTYQEFYPLGMSEYHDANLPQLPVLLARFKAAADAHLLPTYSTEVTELGNRITGFTTARNAQQTTLGEIETLQTGRREDRKALTVQLTTNLLTIAIQNIGNPDNYNNYYNPGYLPLTEEARSFSGLIPFMTVQTAVTQGIVTSSSTLTLYNQGDTDLDFSINDQPATINPSHLLQVRAGEHARLDGNLPLFAQYYINVQNPHPTDNGKWKVVVG